MELEAIQALLDDVAAAGILQALVDNFLLLPALGADSHRIPHLHQERLKVVREPEALGVSVLHGEQHVLVWQHRALWDRLDRDGQPAAELPCDVLPALPVEDLLVIAPDRMAEVHLEVRLGLRDLLHRHHLPDEILLQEVLQAEEADLRIRAAAALEVGVDLSRPRRVLQVVGHLVGVGEHKDVVELVDIRDRTLGTRSRLRSLARVHSGI
mmetsp:Transcript_37070/g.95732  ORF Transcript_37070/g.95732 Transcript_37070/m.95732 type:complete len:211 (-) Transcript_37070:114-746(-)